MRPSFAGSTLLGSPLPSRVAGTSSSHQVRLLFKSLLAYVRDEFVSSNGMLSDEGEKQHQANKKPKVVVRIVDKIE